MGNDWTDQYNGDVSNLGPNPYGFNGSPNSTLPVQQQQGANPLGGLAAALQMYGGGNSVNAGGMNGFSGGVGDSFGTVSGDSFAPSMDLPAGY